MSGFAAIVSLDGAPPRTERLASLTKHIARNGSGEPVIQSSGSAALAFAPLASGIAGAAPASFLLEPDGSWILGDIRVDGQDALREALAGTGKPVPDELDDAALVLQTYRAWGYRMLDHLIGDFSFAIWDATRRELFCARDHFGIKPFYFSRTAFGVLFSNDITALRQDPSVSDRLHKPAIADFLAYGINLDESTTTFVDIKRLPPGHYVRFAADSTTQPLSYRQLWPEQTIRYTDQRDYQEHFLSLLRAAVGDRLRTDRVGFELSGGLDSTTVAAMAMRLGREIPGFHGLGITTDNSHRSPEDEETRYAAMVAAHIGCEHRSLPAAPDEDLFRDNETAEPSPWAFTATLRRFAAAIGENHHVMLSGQGGDPFMTGSGYYVLDRFRAAPLSTFLAEILRIAWKRKTPRGIGLTALWKRDLPRIHRPKLPGWLREDFAQSAGVEERWESLFYRPGRYPPGCTAELAWDEAHMPSWTQIFERYYHDVFHGIDCRHPFFDMRLVRFLLAIPQDLNLDKNILREATADLLPERVRTRQKFIAPIDLLQSSLVRTNELRHHDLAFETLGDWVETEQYRKALLAYASGESGDQFTMACPINLDLWIKSELC